jgi:hypothetical protein
MTSINGVPLPEIIFSLDLSLQAFAEGGSFPAAFTQLATFGGGETFFPKVTVGTASGSTYIVVRGSTEPADFALNLQGAFTPFLTGCAHDGVLRASRWIIEQSRQFIDSATGRVIVTGHSLGGSCAAVIATILALEEKKPNVIAIAAAPFPVLSPDLQKATEPFVTSLIFARDIVPQLTGSNCKQLLLSIAGTDSVQAPIVAGAALVQLFTSILKSRGVNDHVLFQSLAQSLASAVPGVLGAPVPPFELRIGGAAFGVNRTPSGGFTIDPYEEGRILTMPEVLVGVVDHNLAALVQALRVIDAPTPAGPAEVEDLD